MPFYCNYYNRYVSVNQYLTMRQGSVVEKKELEDKFYSLIPHNSGSKLDLTLLDNCRQKQELVQVILDLTNVIILNHLNSNFLVIGSRWRNG